jgi:hypothetical protein
MNNLELLIPPSLHFLAPVLVDDLVRVGLPRGDGAYVVPRSAVTEADFLISLGVGKDWSFDQQALEMNPALEVHAYDYSVSEISLLIYILKAPVAAALKLLAGREHQHSLKEKIQLLKSYKSFFSRKEVTHFRERINNTHEKSFDITLDEAFARVSARNIFLKIDIEGAEYKIIDDIVKHADRLPCIAIEFHDTGSQRAQFTSAVSRLQELFEIVHLHANNNGGIAQDGVPEVLELTFAKKPVLNIRGRRTALPVPQLDSATIANLPDYELTFAL